MAFFKHITGAAGVGLAAGYLYERVTRRFFPPTIDRSRGLGARSPLEMPWTC